MKFSNKCTWLYFNSSSMFNNVLSRVYENSSRVKKLPQKKMACIISMTLFYLLVTFLTYLEAHSMIPLHKENNNKNAYVIVLYTKTPNDYC
jgi:hypothetical protein